MAIDLRIEKVRDGTEVHATQPKSISTAAFCCMGALVCAGYLTWKAHDLSLVQRGVIVLVGVGFLVDGIRRLRDRSMVLRVTNLELRASGALAEMNPLPRWDIEELKYLQATKHRSQGLYATHGWSSTCLVPNITEDQAWEVRDAIYERFPDTAAHFPDKEHLTLLGLSKH